MAQWSRALIALPEDLCQFLALNGSSQLSVTQSQGIWYPLLASTGMAHTWCMYINTHKSSKVNVFKRKLTKSNGINALSQSREEGSCLSGALFLQVRGSSSKNSWALCWEWERIFTLPGIWPVYLYIYNPTSKTTNKPICKDPSVLSCVKITEMAYITKRH